MKILCLIPTLPNEIKDKTLHSIFNQTVSTDYIFLLTKKMDTKVSLPQKISSILNDGLIGIKLESYDYILRLDSDTILPPDFLEKHVALNVDVVGGEGYAQLIKVPFFLNKMNGQFNKDSDDTYTYFKAVSCGLASERITLVDFKQPGTNYGMVQTQVYVGKMDYMIGDDPINVIIRFLSYFYYLFTFKRCFDFAKSERYKHLSLMLRRLHL